MGRKVAIDETQVRTFLTELFADDMHAKRILSLSHATLGAVHAASLAIGAIGRALAMARGFMFEPKHAIKQVDRLLSNEGLDVWRLFAQWVPFILGGREEAVVTLDWTDFDADGQSTLVATLLTKHGRSTPLIWLTVKKDALKGRRAEYEDRVLARLRECIPSSVATTLLMDRGFADVALYELLGQLGFDYVVRFRAGTWVTSADGQRRKAGEWVPPSGHAKLLKGARVTEANAPVGAVAVVKKKGMKDAWALVTSFTEASAADIIASYGRRFSTEETFRDVKDLRFGMGLSSVSVKSPERRDRLLLVSALAQSLLTLLGAAGESLGYDRGLKANTVKTRTHSLFTQGAYYYQAMANWSQAKLEPLVEKFGQLVREQAVFKEAFGLL